MRGWVVRGCDASAKTRDILDWEKCRSPLAALWAGSPLLAPHVSRNEEAFRSRSGATLGHLARLRKATRSINTHGLKQRRQLFSFESQAATFVQHVRDFIEGLHEP